MIYGLHRLSVLFLSLEFCWWYVLFEYINFPIMSFQSMILYCCDKALNCFIMINSFPHLIHAATSCSLSVVMFILSSILWFSWCIFQWLKLLMWYWPSVHFHYVLPCTHSLKWVCMLETNFFLKICLMFSFMSSFHLKIEPWARNWSSSKWPRWN